MYYITFIIQRSHVSAPFTLQVLVLEHLEGDVVERALAMKEASTRNPLRQLKQYRDKC